ncbi:Organic cation/carnitine transporter 3 [Rhynchospora pubera]|uniref:H(+)/Pi cotransporter n=1 Tax=Rhynchospora pubera TaxID=906938 RepID=A0AAV8EG78_9POAL|nr:Organic cation/carnitine transporter 3 [Rhynchospora pubera]
MVDPSPLLTQNSNLQNKIVVSTGRSSSLKLLQSIIVALAWIFDGQQTFITVFTDSKPNWKCLDLADPICKSASNPCHLKPGSWAWLSPADTSIVSEWSLECADTALLSLPASAFFAGCIVGGLSLSTLADSVLGRKMLLILSCLIMSLAGCMTVLSPNIWVYSALKFVCGLGRASVGTASLVLSMEIVDQRWRDRIGVLGFAFYMVGFMTLPIMAYVGRNLSWRLLYLCTNVPSFCYAFFLYYTVPESPRWLMVHNQNKACYSELHEPNNSSDEKNDFYSSMKILCTSRRILWMLLAVMATSLGISFVYYGMPFAVRNLETNIYVSVGLNALSELPASLLALFLTVTMNRRSSILTLTTISGLSSFACAFNTTIGAARKLQLAAEVISYCGACTAFNVLMIYCVELFPTTIRNTAIALVREAGLLAGVVAPILAAKGENNRFWSYGFFGLVIVLCGLSCRCLPETKGSELSDQIEEGENNSIGNC